MAHATMARSRYVIDVETSNPDILARITQSLDIARLSEDAGGTEHYLRFDVHEADDAGVPTHVISEVTYDPAAAGSTGTTNPSHTGYVVVDGGLVEQTSDGISVVDLDDLLTDMTAPHHVADALDVLAAAGPAAQGYRNRLRGWLRDRDLCEHCCAHISDPHAPQCPTGAVL